MKPSIGQQIANGRHRRGWTQRDLGDQMGIGTSLIAKWEQGIRVPAPEWLAELEQVLQLSFDVEVDAEETLLKPRRGPKPAVTRKRATGDDAPVSDDTVVLVELSSDGVRVFHGSRELEAVVVDLTAMVTAPAQDRVKQISELLLRSLDLPRPLADRVVRRMAEFG